MSGDYNEAAIEAVQKETDDKDNRLENWTTWLKEWERVNTRIKEKIKPKSELLMNASEGLRSINEEKLVFQYSEIPTEFDKHRGNPNFWKMPPALTPKHPCEGKKYFAQWTNAEKFMIPSLEMVGMSQLIMAEKNLMDNTRNMYMQWKSGKYRQERMNKLLEKFQLIVPHRPSFTDLAVQGSNKVTNPEEDEQSVVLSEQSTETKNTSLVEKSFSGVINEPPKINLKINGIDFDKNGESPGFRNIRINFEYDISSCVISRDTLIFENQSTVTLRISWQKLNKFRLFRNYTNEKWEKHGFYFDRNELLILPGCKSKIPIWFKTENSGIYSESWEMKTVPKLWNDDFHVILILRSYAYFRDLKEKVNKIVTSINVRARNLLIKDILRTIVDEAKYGEVPYTPCVYGEPQLFEIMNLANGRPEFLFDEEVVNELKMIYDKVKAEGAGKWDYSIKQLKKLSHEKDVAIYLENKVTELAEKIANIKKSKSNIKELAVKKSKSSKGKKKDKKGKSKKGKGSSKKSKGSSKSGKHKKSGKSTHDLEVVDKPEKKEIIREKYIYSNQFELWDVVKKLNSPVVLNSERIKYFCCVNVMSGHFKKMCDSLNLLRLEYNLNKSTGYPRFKNKIVPIEKQPERLIYEYFEDDYLPIQPSEIYPFQAKPKPKILRNIPSGDIETVYCSYFNKTLPSVKQQSKKILDKKKKGKSKPSKKTKKDSSKSSSKKNKKGSSKSSSKKKKGKSASKSKFSKEAVVKNQVSVEAFDPYAEQFIYDSENETEDNSVLKPNTKRELAQKMLEDYKYQQHIIVYSCLSDAVSALVDTLNSFECIVSYDTLNEMQRQCPRDNDTFMKERKQ